MVLDFVVTISIILEIPIRKMSVSYTHLDVYKRQVLGPTYATTGTNVAAEMVKGMGVA